MLEINKNYCGDCQEILSQIDSNSIDCCVTSPPYFGLRDYGVENQIGLEKTVEDYVDKLVVIFKEVKRVLKQNGTFWLNLGDSYSNTGKWGGLTGGKHQAELHGPSILREKRDIGLKAKELIGIPWKVAFALQADGWYLRQDIIWHKPNAMPESVRDRCTKAHEYIFLLTKSPKYYYDFEAVKEQAVCPRMRGPALHRDMISTNGNGGLSRRTPTKFRNRRSVWSVSTKPYKGAHFATFPPDLIEPCVLAGSPENGIVLDPFMGAGTVALVARKYNRNFIGIELNPQYIKLAEERLLKV